MNVEADKPSRIHLGIIGNADFCRRASAVISAEKRGIQTFAAAPSEAWAAVLSNRPNALLLGIGIHHSERQQAWLRSFLSQLRERSGPEIYTILALLSPTNLFYGGDLLFKEESLTPSGFVDTFIALPPGTAPSIPGLAEQINNVMSLYQEEIERRDSGQPPLPALGAPGWAQSMADPRSRELWNIWLPRYASYTNENPVIIGETGTGKTNLAFALHQHAGLPGDFISITPRDFSSSELIQGELFGAVEGAYTGAVDKWGLVKKAEKGTLFIDELQSIDKALQGKLITFIENKVYRRVGSAETTEADVRFVFASNISLYDMMESDILRHDFAYRLERVRLEMLPLRMRRLDITAALAYALAKIHRQRSHSRVIRGVNAAAYRMLFSHSWPGNLRQLENSTAKLCEMTDMKRSVLIDQEDVSLIFDSKLAGPATTASEVISQAAQKLAHLALSNELTSLEDGMNCFSQIVRMSALEASGGDIEKASVMIEDNKKLMTYIAHDIMAKTETGFIK